MSPSLRQASFVLFRCSFEDWPGRTTRFPVEKAGKMMVFVGLGVDSQSESVVVQFRPPNAFRDLPGFRAK
jgi:hypothetical protein